MLIAYIALAVAGFGSALISIPLLVLFLPIKLVIPVVLVVDFVATASTGLRFRRDIALDELKPIIVPIPSMSSLYSDTTQLPPTTGVAAPVSFQVSLTSNSSSTSSSEVFSLFSVGSSTSMAVTWPSRMPATAKSVTGV